MRSTIAIVWGIIALVLVNVSVWNKEHLLANGQVVYLQLAPVDPRSLMQGDYMALRFSIATRLDPSMLSRSGNLVVTLDERRVAAFRRVDDGQPLAPNELRLRYRLRNAAVKFATNAFFFQEGDAQLYANAAYGEFRVADNGDLLLTGLRATDLHRLGPPERSD